MVHRKTQLPGNPHRRNTASTQGILEDVEKTGVLDARVVVRTAMLAVIVLVHVRVGIRVLGPHLLYYP